MRSRPAHATELRAHRRLRWEQAAVCLLVGFAWLSASPCSVLGQVSDRSIALPPAEIERMDSTAATHLENAQRFLEEKQWDEAIEAIRRVMENDSGQFVPITGPAGFLRWIPVREYCQWRLAALSREAPEALASYRTLVDPLAEQWYRDARAQRRENLLRRIIDQAFASRWGDDALLLASEFRLQAGDYAAARADCMRISPQFTEPAARTTSSNPLDDHYPDTDLNLGEVRARLALISIMQGSLKRAAGELDLLRRLHADAEGQIAGRQGKYVDLLNDLLEQAKGWPPERMSSDWSTFAGNLERNGQAAGDLDIAGQPTWVYMLPKLTAERDLIGAGRLRVADDSQSLLAYHPVVVDGTVLLRSESRQKSIVAALDIQTGESRWEVDYARSIVGQQTAAEPTSTDLGDAHQGLSRHVGVARSTLTAADGKLFARLGSPVTAPSARSAERLLSKDQGWLLGLDLQTEGKPLEGFPIRPESSAWSFDGTPIYDRGLLYVVMRRSEGARVQMYVACFDLPTSSTAVDDADDDARPTGRLRWRTKLVSAMTIGGGDVDELSQVLLTLAHGRLYCNTNVGVVACLSAESGKPDWLVAYPRATFRANDPDEAENHFFRDLTPCMLAGDFVIIAPADGRQVFAVEAVSGRVAWGMAPGVGDDVVHLLGSSHDVLIASGERLYWIDLATGTLLTQFPNAGSTAAGLASPSPRGFGRGVLTRNHVWWPTRENIFVFDQQPTKTDRGWQPLGARDIPLVPRGASGGNLVIAQGVLLIASGDRLFAFDEQGPARPSPEAAVEVR